MFGKYLPEVLEMFTDNEVKLAIMIVSNRRRSKCVY